MDMPRIDEDIARFVRRATELIDRAGPRTLEHRQLACEMSRRIHGEDGRLGRMHG